MLRSSAFRLDVSFIIPIPVLEADSRLGSIFLQMCFDPSDALHFVNVVLDSGPSMKMFSFVDFSSSLQIMRSVCDILIVCDDVDFTLCLL
eukprot:5374411-Heterocapsa_arctica.AAC.1